tara:strand:- start:1050 stop:1253 length:204 start_codon:yes stop_codon:yes gene_type:complete
MPRAGMSRLDTSIPTPLKERLDVLAQLHGVWQTDIIAEALRLYLDKLEHKAPAPEESADLKGFRHEC